MLHQLIRHGDAVDFAAPLAQFAHPPVDPPMLLQAEIVGVESRRYLDEISIVHQNGSKHEALGIHIRR